MIARACRQGWYLFLMVHMRRYRSTFFGYAWMAVEPIALLLPLLVAGQAFDLAPGAASGLPYATFAFSGVVLWLAFAGVILQSLTAYRLTRKRARRLQIEPLAPLVVGILHTAIGLAFLVPGLVVLAIVQDVPVSAWVMAFPLPALVACAAGAVIALPLVLADAVYRDAQRASHFLMAALFWTVPVIHLPPAGTILDAVARVNPLSDGFVLWRALLTGDGIAAALPAFGISAAVIVALLAVIVRLFRARFWEAIDYVR